MAFAVGDVNGDGRADLASGDLEQPPGGHVDLRISGDGNTPATTQRLEASSAGMPWVGTANGRFGDGDSLAGLNISLHDLNCDGSADLTIGAPAGSWGNGVVSWLPGTRTGLTTKGAIAFSSATLGLQARDLGETLIP
jgi:hypothetical protein